MLNGSTNRNSMAYSSLNNNGILRLSTDSSYGIDQNNNRIKSNKTTATKSNTQTHSGYITRSQRSNLTFSVSRVENHLRKGRYADRIGATASVYLAGVLEYLVAEIVELAGDITHSSKRKRITPRDIALAIKNDDELDQLCTNVTIPEGGVQPFIHQVLLTTKKRRRTRRVRFDEDNLKDTSSNEKQSSGKRSTTTDSNNVDADDELSSDSDLQME